MKHEDKPRVVEHIKYRSGNGINVIEIEAAQMTPDQAELFASDLKKVVSLARRTMRQFPWHNRELVAGYPGPNRIEVKAQILPVDDAEKFARDVRTIVNAVRRERRKSRSKGVQR